MGLKSAPLCLGGTPTERLLHLGRIDLFQVDQEPIKRRSTAGRKMIPSGQKNPINFLMPSLKALSGFFHILMLVPCYHGWRVQTPGEAYGALSSHTQTSVGLFFPSVAVSSKQLADTHAGRDVSQRKWNCEEGGWSFELTPPP